MRNNHSPFIDPMQELFSHVRSDDMDDDIILPESIDDLPDLDEVTLSFTQKEKKKRKKK